MQKVRKDTDYLNKKAWLKIVLRREISSFAFIKLTGCCSEFWVAFEISYEISNFRFFATGGIPLEANFQPAGVEINSWEIESSSKIALCKSKFYALGYSDSWILMPNVPFELSNWVWMSCHRFHQPSLTKENFYSDRRFIKQKYFFTIY